MIDRRRLCALALALLLALGCAGRGTQPPSPQATETRVEALAAALESLAASPEQSTLLARTAVLQSHVLAREYAMTRPALLHNVLVNVGLRERGLCWHWTEDLLARLGALPLDAFELHWATAHRGEMFREHNSVVVTARGGDFDTGIVLDPWRDSGVLYWGPVRGDRYPWEPRFDRLRSTIARSARAASAPRAPAVRK